jgi:hypothetical protein
MVAADESQGLKIAVAAFITLTVILAVTSYFLYSNAATAQARLDFEHEARAMDKHAAAQALRQYDEIRTRIGTKAVEFDAVREEISADFKKVDDRLNNLMGAVNAAVQAAQQRGSHGPELEAARLDIQKAIASYRSEPNKSYISALDRLTELMEQLVLLKTQLSHDDVGVKKSLDGDTGAAKAQKDQGSTTKDQGPKTKD